MPEVVQPAEPGRVEDELVDELLEGRLDGGRGYVHDPGQDLGHEAPPDDGAGAGGRLGLGRQGRDPGDDRVLDGLGDARLADRRAIGSSLGAERPEQLLDVERDPVGPLVDRGRDIARGGQPGVEDQCRDESRLRGIEPHQPDLLGDPLGDESGAPLAKARTARHVLGPVVAGQQEGAIPRPPSELGDDLEAHVVGPLEVLEGQHRRSRQRT